jgi:hypothetical protein
MVSIRGDLSDQIFRRESGGKALRCRLVEPYTIHDPCDERVLAVRFSRQDLFRHFDDVARPQQFEARLVGHVPFDDEQYRHIANMTIVT